MSESRKSMEPWLLDSVDFYGHQITGVRRAMTMRNVLWADEMGLGKSLQAITTAIGDVFLGRADKILVVAPVTLKGNWSDEFKKFTRIPPTILGEGPDPKRPNRMKTLPPRARSVQIEEFATQSGPRALICNYEQVIKHIKELNKIGFHIAIFDEAHYLKNHKAKRTQACHLIQAARYFCLTGTPMLNQVDELWGILHLMDRNGFPKYWTFRNRYCVFGGYESKQIIGVKNERELIGLLQKYQIRRLKKDVLDLPEIQTVKRKVYLSDKQQKVYDKAEDELLIEIAGFSTPQEIEFAMVKMLRLKQICGTLIPFTGEDESSKLDLAAEDAIEIMKSGHKIIAFTQYRAVLEAYASRLDKLAPEFDIWELHGDIPKHDRVPFVKEWSAHPKPAIIICMLQVAGVGLNMTAASHVQLIDKMWTPGMNQQAIDRAHRIGTSTTQPVQVWDYLCRGTVETRVEAVLRQKIKLIGDVVDDESGDTDYKKQLLAALRKKEEEEDDD